MTFSSYFAGLWPIVKDYSLVVAMLGGLGAIVWFRPALWKPVAIAAGVIIYGAVTYTIGLNNGLDRRGAQWTNEQKVTDGKVKSAVDGGADDAANGVRDPFQLD